MIALALPPSLPSTQNHTNPRFADPPSTCGRLDRDAIETVIREVTGGDEEGAVVELEVSRCCVCRAWRVINVMMIMEECGSTALPTNVVWRNDCPVRCCRPLMRRDFPTMRSSDGSTRSLSPSRSLAPRTTRHAASMPLLCCCVAAVLLLCCRYCYYDCYSNSGVCIVERVQSRSVV